MIAKGIKGKSLPTLFVFHCSRPRVVLFPLNHRIVFQERGKEFSLASPPPFIFLFFCFFVASITELGVWQFFSLSPSLFHLSSFMNNPRVVENYYSIVIRYWNFFLFTIFIIGIRWWIFGKHYVPPDYPFQCFLFVFLIGLIVDDEFRTRDNFSHGFWEYRRVKCFTLYIGMVRRTETHPFFPFNFICRH